MFPLRPNEKFQVVYTIADPNDSNTYYVRSVLRNSKTGATIATYNLTDAGSGRFYKEITAPADPTGQGLYIDITTTVYEDSGYTTKSSSYQQENRAYIVDYRRAGSFGAPFGGSPISSGPDYTIGDFKKAIEEVISPLKTKVNDIEKLVLEDSKEDASEGSEMDDSSEDDVNDDAEENARLNAIFESLGRLETAVRGVQNTKVVETVRDYPMTSYIDKVQTIVSEAKPEDVTPLVQELITLTGYLADAIERMQKNKLYDETYIKNVVTEAVKSVMPGTVTKQLQNIFSSVIDASNSAEPKQENPQVMARNSRVERTLKALNLKS